MNRWSRLLAIAACGCVVSALPVVGATTAQASDSCASAPTIDVWYDSDQYGSYTKVSFHQDAVCSGMPRVVTGEVYCTGPEVGTVYSEAADAPNGPMSLPTGSLPDSCQSFSANGWTSYPAYGGAVDVQDTWQWNKGDQPA
jgi:hypothetical protein